MLFHLANSSTWPLRPLDERKLALKFNYLVLKTSQRKFFSSHSFIMRKSSDKIKAWWKITKIPPDFKPKSIHYNLFFFFGFDRAFNWNVFAFYASDFFSFFLSFSCAVFEWFHKHPKNRAKNLKRKTKKKEIENDSKLFSFSFSNRLLSGNVTQLFTVQKTFEVV